MKSAAESINVIMHSIGRSDSQFTSPCGNTGYIYCRPKYTRSISLGFFDDLIVWL